MGKTFKTSEIFQAIEGFIRWLDTKQRLQGKEKDLNEYGYSRLLMVANAAYRDGVAAEFAGFANVLANHFLTHGNLEGLPSNVDAAIKEFIAEAAAE